MACNPNRDKMSTFLLANTPTVRDQQSSSDATTALPPTGILCLLTNIRALTMSIVGANAARDLPPLGSAPHFEFSTATDKP
jgi:hypothetical protein